ncbi:DUF2231 domain-containing protein [Actinokineospora enzanensis]|uniref:DUF2231 domain-containing protein n=1 Tax=Actinokineospora enzanensis TaxID=155975 RepID=UPI0003773F61|nr:DUF2231 domain-containing protein [Actinokineospora enzanensis]
MTTINGLPAHILLVHAIVVLLPLSALLLVLSGVWDTARRKFAGANALLAVLVVVLVPITTDAGEWLERRVPRTDLVRTHTELGDSALFFAIPVAVLALVMWWRQRESTATATAESEVDGGPTAAARRTLLAPGSKPVTIVLAVLTVLAAGAACYQVYRIGDSGARASWQDQFSSTPAPGRPGGDH